MYLTGGFEIIPQIRVGGGLVYYYATEELSVDKALPGGQDGLVTLADSGGAVSWDASIEIQPILDVPFRIGVDYKQQAFMKLKGPANFAFPPPFAAVYPNQDFNHMLPYPSTFNVGVAWRPIPDGRPHRRLHVRALQRLRVGHLRGADHRPGHRACLSSSRCGETTATPASSGWAWPGRSSRSSSFGPAASTTSPGVNPAYFNPSLPDGNAWAGSLGLGWDVMKDLSISASFFNAWFTTLNSVPAASTATLDNASSFPGQFKSWAWIASLGLNWKWDPQAKQAQAN